MSGWLLLVEDEPDVQLIARASLRRAGFDVRTADTGRQALDALSTDLPRAVVMDWFMPELDGSDACAAIKADPRTRHLPVIFLTARSDADAEMRCLALGAIGCITKPFEPLRLGDQVKALLERAEAEAETRL
jgi:two-component system phosphate regulon response regulator PhoB